MIFTETDIDNNLNVRMYQSDQMIQQVGKGRMGILHGDLAQNGLITI